MVKRIELEKKCAQSAVKYPTNDEVIARINAAAALPTAHASCTRCGKYRETWRVTAMSFFEFR